MSRILKIGDWSIDADSIVAIRRFDYEQREYIYDKGQRAFPMCLLDFGKDDIYDGKQVYRDALGGRFVLLPSRKRMQLFFDNKEDIIADLNEAIIAQWEAAKDGKPSV